MHEQRMVEEGPNKGKMFCMYRTFCVAKPKKYFMIHAAFSSEEANAEGIKFAKEINRTDLFSTVRI